MFLAKSFTVPVELVQKKDVVTERPFIPSLQKTAGATSQMQKATQPVEAPSTPIATQPVEAPIAFVCHPAC